MTDSDFECFICGKHHDLTNPSLLSVLCSCGTHYHVRYPWEDAS